MEGGIQRDEVGTNLRGCGWFHTLSHVVDNQQMMSAGVKGQMEESDKVELVGIGRYEEATGQLDLSVQVVMGYKWELQRLFTGFWRRDRE